MLIDGFTVVAQIINFLILVFLLRRFLYGPITRAMDERQARIAEQIAEAEELKRQAAEEVEAYQRQREELNERRDILLAEAKEEAETRRRESLRKARHEVEEAHAGWQRGIEAEKAAFIRDVRLGIGRQVYGVSRRVLADLADAELEQRILEVFRRRLADLDDDERRVLTATLQSTGNQAVVRSAFEISDDERDRLNQAIAILVGEEASVNYQVKSDLVCGIELIIGDYKLAWNLDDYLVDLEDALFQSLDEAGEPEYEGS